MSPKTINHSAEPVEAVVAFLAPDPTTFIVFSAVVAMVWVGALFVASTFFFYVMVVYLYWYMNSLY